jgi:integrase/recombinase XerC
MSKELFLRYLQYEKRYSPHTLRSYKNDLDQFSEFCLYQDLSPTPESAGFKLIRSWIVYLMDEGFQPRSVNRKLSSLRSYFHFLIQQGIITSDPTTRVVPPKSIKKLPVYVPDEEMNLLLDKDFFEDNFVGWRSRLVIELLYHTGIRLSELISLTIGNIDFNSETIKVVGKRNKERIIPYSPILNQTMLTYLKMRNEMGITHDKLIVTERGEPAYARLIYRIVNHHLTLVSAIEKRSPHIIRHSFATHLLNNGADLNAIKELLGHTRLSATQVYTHNSFKHLKEVYKQAHPRA